MKLPVFSRFRRAGPLGPLPSVSRRHFFGASAGAAGVMLGSGLWTPVRSDDDDQGENGEQGEKGQVCPAADPIPPVALPVNVTGVRTAGFDGESEMLAERGELTVIVCDDVAVWPEESVIVNATA